LIKFVTWVDGEWKEYKSNTFYLNRPIYFQVKDITTENLESYKFRIVGYSVDKTVSAETHIKMVSGI